MTRRNINLCSLFTCGCIILLFVRNIHSFPHTDFDDSNSSESSESNEDEVGEREIHTTRATVPIRGNHSLNSNRNHVKGNGTNLRNYRPQNISADEIATLIEPRFNPMQNDDGRIFFPMEGTLRIEPRCNSSVFCENVPNYPEDMINNAIRRNGSLQYLEIIDEILDIQPKLGPSDPDERPLCESISQIIRPQMAPSKYKGDLIVVNQPNFKQEIRIEKCVNENGECSIAGNNIPGGYRTKCVQKYIDRKLIAVTGVDKVTQELFPIPSSCCCHAVLIKGTERFGMGVKQTNQVTTANTLKN